MRLLPTLCSLSICALSFGQDLPSPSGLKHQVSSKSIDLIVEDQYQGFSLINTGPRGGVYTNQRGETFDYRVFRVDIKNDSSEVLLINLKLPNDSIFLLPDSKVFIDYKLIPSSFTPVSPKNILDFGIQTGNLFEVNPQLPNQLTQAIQPNEWYSIYFILNFKTQITEGKARVKLFKQGLSVGPPYLPPNLLESTLEEQEAKDLQLAIAIGQLDYYRYLTVGSINYLSN